MTLPASIQSLLSAGEHAGCTEAEVQALEDKFKVALPADYRSFLLAYGRGAVGLWKGSDYKFDDLIEINEAAVELLKEAGLCMPSGAFVFFMHQGYQFFALHDGGVIFFLEGESNLETRYSSFSDFLESTKTSR